MEYGVWSMEYGGDGMGWDGLNPVVVCYIYSIIHT